MDELTRRAALQRTTGAGFAGVLGSQAGRQAADNKVDEVPKSERDRVIAIGMTEGEADCWIATAEAAGKFFDLPQMHPMDKQEVSMAIYVIQNKLLSRPTYRKYLGPAKAVKPK